jgi:hypothetical protein
MATNGVTTRSSKGSALSHTEMDDNLLCLFKENLLNVTSNYTIRNGYNAMSAGPITINNGVTVTVGAGETWTVV